MRKVLDITNDALREIGLPQVLTVMSDLGDQTGFQTSGLINALGKQLIKLHDWQFLEQHLQFVGDGVKTQFDMPADFGRMVNQTQWASKSRRPMFGPMTPQGWSWIEFGIVSVGVYYRYRIVDNKFTVFPTPAAGETFDMYYISKNWVINQDAGTVYKSEITQDSDIPMFDDSLMVAGTKFKLWAAKGFDATELREEFNAMLEAEKSQSQGAPVIALDRRFEYLYISGQNVPDGSWNV